MFVASEDYQDIGLSLDKRLIRRPAATFFLRAAEEDADAGLKRGDLLVVDRAEPPSPGRLVVARENGELAARRWGPASRETELWGTVLWIIRAP